MAPRALAKYIAPPPPQSSGIGPYGVQPTAAAPNPYLDTFLGIARNYLDRQKALAQGGLDQASMGAEQLQNANPMGAANMVLGPLGYLSSPLTALLPTSEEINNAPDLPEWAKPGVNAGVETAAWFLPGFKGKGAAKGLGKGMEALAGEAAPAEQAALKARLEGEAAQTAGAPSAIPRDQALGNLVEQPTADQLAYIASIPTKVTTGVMDSRGGLPRELMHNRREALRVLNDMRPLYGALEKAHQAGDVRQVQWLMDNKIRPMAANLEALNVDKVVGEHWREDFPLLGGAKR